MSAFVELGLRGPLDSWVHVAHLIPGSTYSCSRRTVALSPSVEVE